MSEDLTKKFSEELMEGDWAMFSPQYKNQSLFLIDSSIGLIEAAVALASDDVSKVKVWKESNLIRNFTEDEAAEFEKEPYRKFAQFLIVQPFVLARLI